MSREVHVRFCESGRGRFPPATHLVVLARTRQEAEAADRLVRRALADIGLEVAEAKSGVKSTYRGFEFLGFAYKGALLKPRPAAVAKFKDRVRSLTRRTAPVSLAHMIEEDLNPAIRGWGNYFAIGEAASLFDELDGWIRERLRSKVEKRKARGFAHERMPRVYFRRLGLVSLVELRKARLSPA